MPDWAWPIGWAAVFLATGLVGVWAAYERQAAWQRFGLILAGTLLALVVAWIGRKAGERGLAAVGLLCALLAAALAAYFLLTFDWLTVAVVKVPALYQAGLWLQGHRPAVPVLEDLHSNVAGGSLALLLPLAAGAIVWAWRRWPWPILLVACAALGLGLVGLLFTVSRGAWLGLAAGGALAACLAARGSGWQNGRRRAVEAGSLAVLVLLAAAILYLAVTGTAMAVPLVDASTSSRPELWREGLDLVGDYPFTGSGLDSTKMVHATYVMMLQAGLIGHMHNLPLQIAVEQGIPGLMAFAALVVLAIASLVRAWRRTGRVTPPFAGAVAALAALLVHGSVDAGVYAGLAAPLVFLPIGYALGLAPPGRAQASRILGCATAALALVLFLPLLSPVRAALLSNLGAVAQTRAELSRYKWPDVPLQDALRRSPDVDLQPAMARYAAALALDPSNATANRRLGQIELSRGQYDAAREHLEAAYAAAPGQRATRQLLGECYAIAGETSRAAALWAGADVGRSSFRWRIWWYVYVGEAEKARRIRGVVKGMGM